MSEVKRYEPEAHSYSGAHATMELEDDGDWVAYSDYEKLQAENKRLREALEELNTQDAPPAVWEIINNALAKGSDE